MGRTDKKKTIEPRTSSNNSRVRSNNNLGKKSQSLVTSTISIVNESLNASQLSNSLQSPSGMTVLSDREDGTDSAIDEDGREMNKLKFSNKNRKGKVVSIKQYFTMTENNGNCNLCQNDIPVSSRSDANLRTHLANNHDMKDVLYKSQLRESRQKSRGFKFDQQEKKKIDSAMIDCIIRDSRSFNDFDKPGMRMFLKCIKPGYKPCCREKIGKCIKEK